MAEQNRISGDGAPRPWWLQALRYGLLLAGVGRAASAPGEPRAVGELPPDRDGEPSGDLLHPSVQFEPTDTRFAPILGILIAAMCFAAVVHYAILMFFYKYRTYEDTIKRSHYPLAASAAEMTLPPEPRLEQYNRIANVEQSNVYFLQSTYESILQSYGPTENGFVHIPINRAMEQLAATVSARRKPRAETDVRRQNGLVDAGESNSGRMFRGKQHD